MAKMITSITVLIVIYRWRLIRASPLTGSAPAFVSSKVKFVDQVFSNNVVKLSRNRKLVSRDEYVDSENSLNRRSQSSLLKAPKCSTKLYGMSEWRDILFNSNLPSGRPELREGISAEVGQLPREVTVLPFPCDEVLLQGETKELHLYEERFIKLFDKCINEHSGVFAMGLISDSGIIQTVPLCEVETYNNMGDKLGIFVSARVVGRAALVDITNQVPYITGVCVEITDKMPVNLDLPNMVAGNVENTIIQISALEQKLKKDSEGDNDRDSKMRDKMLRYKLDAIFYDDKSPKLVKDEDLEEVSDDEEFFESNDQFKLAYQNALFHDTQGYQFSTPSLDTEGVDQRDVQTLTALSWAAFCVDNMDISFRIQALDCDDLFDRIKLASYTLRERKAELESKFKLKKKVDIDSKKDEEEAS